MDFDYSGEQQQLQQEARRFLEDRCPPSAVRAVLENPELSLDRGLWAGVAELGWLGTVIPEVHGGLGLGYVELCVIAEELGRAVAPVPFASTLYFFAEALLLAGSPAQQAQWLPKIACGELIGCFATAEGPGRPSGALTTVVEAGRITGTKIPVTDGGIADVAIVLAAAAGVPGLYLVQLEQTAVLRVPLGSLDDSRGVASLSFHGAHAEPLGRPGTGLHLVDRVLQRAAVLLAFEQIGGADRCLQMARDYALQRYVFGRPIGSFQAVKHRLADMYVRNELARSNAYYAAWALETNADELPIAAASARLAASDAFGFAAKENIQIHGGAGFTWAADPHLFFRRARQLSLVAGAPAVWGEQLVAVLSSGPASSVVEFGT
jgi:alkylation response protein AidB-like acyl-CoA dehydrogenase